MKDSGYVFKNSDNLYFIGFNDVSDQLRKAKIYHSEKIANKYCNDLNDRCSKLGIKGDFKIIKVAQTIADLEGAPIIKAAHLAEALTYRKR